FYVMNVMTSGKELLSEEDIYNQLRRISKDANSCSNPPRLGVLTSERRKQWAVAREQLCQDAKNKANLDLIERSCFILCLDKPIDASFNHEASTEQTSSGVRDDTNRSLQLLHGMGSKHNGANRWYDKTMQFVVSADGNTGLNYEHSVSEGIAVIKLIEHILAYMEEMKTKRLRRFPSICDLPHPQKLEWHIDKQTEAHIQSGLEEIDKYVMTLSRRISKKISDKHVHLTANTFSGYNLLVDDLDLYILRFDMFGREYPKTVNMSPDSFVQLALQLAHYKVHKYLVPTYESASIRRFHLGRVDVIHAASMAALQWVKAMEGDVKTTNEQKLKLLREAIEHQTEHMLKTILGHGVDNHMLGLRVTAESVMGKLPDLFTDPVYVECNQFRLSTSQVSTTTDALICYGAVVPNGYGAAYNLHTDSIVVCISCWRDCPNPDISALRYGEALRQAFEDMHEMIQANVELAKINTVSTESKIPEENLATTKENGESDSAEKQQ
uniref:Choline O-acetyltransferase n=1 Tax=Macrostomum lignano TaxID=282301 RepID=A0A1I8IV14_9PLAT